MKIAKSDIGFILKLILIWAFANLTLNMFGLWFTKLLNPVEFSYLDSIKYEFVKPLLIQLLLFSVSTTIAYLFLKNKKLALYGFVALQFIAFHVIFFLNVKIHHGMHFATTFNNHGLQYLSFCGQYLVDILYLYFPINGNFENGLFVPDNIATFYIHWILLNIIYYAGLTWLSIRLLKYFSEDKKENKEVGVVVETQE